MSAKAAIVTGASSGIGLAIAEMLGGEGYCLTIVARRPEKLEAAAEQLRAKGIEVNSVAVSLQDNDAPEQIVAAHQERFGRLDVLINNAGVGVARQIDEMADKYLDMQLEVNLRAPIRLLRACMPLLRAAGSEHRQALVVNTSSITGHYPEPELSIYSATKSALIAFTESMHLELSEAGIKSTALCPGFVDTAMAEHYADTIKPGTIMQPSDIAESVRFLLRISPACFVPEIQFVRAGLRNM